MEISLADGFHINQFQSQYTVDMLLVISLVFRIFANVVYIRIFKSLGFGDTQDLITFRSIQKLTMLVQKLQCIPLPRVMTGSQDDSTTSSFHCNGKLGSRSRRKSDIHHIEPHSHQGSTHYILYHLTRNTGITTYYNLITFNRPRLTYQSSISRGEFYNVKRVQALPPIVPRIPDIDFIKVISIRLF